MGCQTKICAAQDPDPPCVVPGTEPHPKRAGDSALSPLLGTHDDDEDSYSGPCHGVRILRQIEVQMTIMRGHLHQPVVVVAVAVVVATVAVVVVVGVGVVGVGVAGVGVVGVGVVGVGVGGVGVGVGVGVVVGCGGGGGGGGGGGSGGGGGGVGVVAVSLVSLASSSSSSSLLLPHPDIYTKGGLQTRFDAIPFIALIPMLLGGMDFGMPKSVQRRTQILPVLHLGPSHIPNVSGTTPYPRY